MSFVPTTTCTGDVTVLPFTGLHIFVPGSTLGTQLVPDVTVTAADADFVVSATLVAVTVCEPAKVGAVYKPLELTVPAVELPPFTPSTDHVTDVFELFVTVAVNCCVPPVAIVALVGLIVTVVLGVATVTAADADFVVSPTLVAVTV